MHQAFFSAEEKAVGIHSPHRKIGPCIDITAMTLRFQTDRSVQTVMTQIRLLPQYDQGLGCLPFNLHLLDQFLNVKTTLFKFKDNNNFSVCPRFSDLLSP